MSWERELVVFVVALLIGLLVATLTVPRGRQATPGLALAILFFMCRGNALGVVRRYPDSRREFSYRERFITSFFLCFFAALAAGLFIF